VNQAKAAGNFGWPFVIADNKPYPIRDFAANTVGKMTDPAAPENPGQRNTGLKTLPPAQPALIWYPYAKSEEFPAMGEGGRNAMAGPVFYHDPGRKYNILGKEDDRTLLTYEWMRGKIFKVKLDAQEKVEKLEVFMEKLVHPMDLEMDKDGSLVLLEYGSDWYFNRNGSVSRLLPEDGNKPPTLSIKPAGPNSYSVDKAADPEGGKLIVTWYLTEGVTERKLEAGSTATVPEGSFEEIRAVATDDKGAIAIARIPLASGGGLPSLALELGKTKDKPGFGGNVNFKVKSERMPDPGQVKVRAPSYMDVALRYSGQADAATRLKEKLKTGGAGVWGDTPMPPQVALKPEDADKLIAAILGLSEGMTETRGTLNGNIRLSPDFGAEPGGAWEISAESPGYAPAKTRIPAK
jgi:cytochrome c